MNDLTLDDLDTLTAWAYVLHIEGHMAPEDSELLVRINAAIAEKKELAGLVSIDNIDDLAECEKKASSPLYEIPKGYALVPVDVLKSVLFKTEESIDSFEFDATCYWSKRAYSDKVTRYKEQADVLNKLIN